MIWTRDGARALATRIRLSQGKPGIYRGIDDEEYHADPVDGGSLSSTEIRKLLDVPARFYAYKYARIREESRSMTYGKASHTRVLGVGPPIVVAGETDDSAHLVGDGGQLPSGRQSPKLRQWEAEQTRAGRIPLLRKEADELDAQVAALKAHPDARWIFDPARGGTPEVTALAEHPETGVVLRMRTDWLPALDLSAGHLTIADYKTSSRRATLDGISRMIEEHGYWVQAAHYLLVLSLLGYGTDPLRDRFCLVVQETFPPYLVSVVAVDLQSVRDGLAAIRKAIYRYLRCLDSGTWPDYTSGRPTIPEIGRPRWARRDFDETEEFM